MDSWLRLPIVRKLFDWKWFLLVCGPASTMIGFGLNNTLEQASLWFILAYFFSCLACVWTIISWLSSDFLRFKNPGIGNRAHRKRAKPIDWRNFYRIKWGGAGFILLVFLVGMMGVRWIQAKTEDIKAQEEIKKQQVALDEELKRSKGRLYPANEPMPSHRCGPIEPNELGSVDIWR